MLILLQVAQQETSAVPSAGKIKLPEPVTDSDTPVEEALLNRRSVREYRNESLSLQDISQLLWAAQGMTGRSFRTVPSAGALYPLEVYLAAGRVDGLSPGVYRYVPAEHSIILVRDGDRRTELVDSAGMQPFVKEAPAAILIAGVYERTTGKYSSRDRDEATGAEYMRGVKYVHMEAGHAAQNVYLQAEALGLGTVTIGAFSDEDVKRVLGLRDDERPLYVMPVGKAA